LVFSAATRLASVRIQDLIIVIGGSIKFNPKWVGHLGERMYDRCFLIGIPHELINVGAMIVTPFGVVGESIVSIAIRNECSSCFSILVSWVIPGMMLPFRNVVGFFDVYYKGRRWRPRRA
jgi:hypothetical protein